MIVALFVLLTLPLVFLGGYRAGVARNRGLVVDALRETKVLRDRTNARAHAAGYRFDAQNRLVAIGEADLRLSDL